MKIPVIRLYYQIIYEIPFRNLVEKSLPNKTGTNLIKCVIFV